MTTKTPSAYLSSVDVRHEFRMSQSTLSRYQRNDPNFPTPSYLGSRRLWKRADIEKWLEGTLTTRPRYVPDCAQ